MKEITTYGRIDKGELIIHNERVWWQQIMDIAFANHVELTLAYGNKRTLDQNSYFWAVCTQIAKRMRDDGWDVDKDMVYNKVEATYCEVKKENPETGKREEFVEPLKKQPTDRFAEIVDTVRQNAMERYPDIYIETPAEFYNMSEGAYARWKAGEINKTQAIKDSK